MASFTTRASLRASGAAYLGMAQGAEIDYERLVDAVADSFIRKGIDRSVIAMDGRMVGRSVEPSVSRATHQRTQQTAAGRAARMAAV